MEYLLIGIDPGVHTGLAVWNCTRNRFDLITTCNIIAAMEIIKKLPDISDTSRSRVIAGIIFEDARKRRWIPSEHGKEVLQGVGSVKRDGKIWEEFCIYNNFDYVASVPKKGATKIKKDMFRKLTGYEGETSEHSRDAAMLVFGKNNIVGMAISELNSSKNIFKDGRCGVVKNAVGWKISRSKKCK